MQKYLRLEQARFRDRLTVRVQVDPDVLQTVVPVLSLQPLVENAVKHGVETRSGQRTIEIVVSLATAPPKDMGSQMLALHAPEGLGLEALERVRA